MKANSTAQGLKPLTHTLKNLQVLKTHEDISLNPQGREGSDGRDKRVKLLGCRHYLYVATTNVRTIRLDSKRQELMNNCEKTPVSILGIVDHKIVHEDPEVLVSYQHFGKYTLITTSAWRNANNAAAGGVGLVVNKNAESALAEVKSWNERILIAHFIGNGFPALTIVVHYSPVEGSDNTEEHYKNLLAAIDKIPKHNVLLVVGDLGENIAKFTYHKNTNSNGKIVNDLVNEAGLIVTNTQFQKKQGKLWTYISDMSGVKSHIDFIMISKKWRNTVKNCEAYITFSSVGSNHRVVTAKLKSADK